MTELETNSRAHCRAGIFWGLEALDQETIQRMLEIETTVPFDGDIQSYIKAVVVAVTPLVNTFIAGRHSAAEALRQQTDELVLQRNRWLKALEDFNVTDSDESTTH
jgi:hypothetical protein